MIDRASDLDHFNGRRKLGEEVTRYLRDALLSGAFVAGQRVMIDDLVQELGVSTMPIREALVALASEGLLEALPRRGFRVAALERRDVEDVFRIHAYVAGLLAEAAATRITSATVAELRKIQAEIQQLARRRQQSRDESAQIELLNYRFHRTINYVADARRLRWLLRTTSRYVPRRFHEAVPGWNAASANEHPRIIAALERHEPRLASRLMSAHFSNAGRLVVAYLEKNGRWLAQAPPRATRPTAAQRPIFR